RSDNAVQKIVGICKTTRASILPAETPIGVVHSCGFACECIGVCPPTVMRNGNLGTRLYATVVPDRSGFERRRLVGRHHTELSQCRMKEVMLKILLLQGANLTFLGRREPEIYGSTTPAELEAMLRSHAHDHAYKLEIFYTNIEGEAINRIYQAVDEGFNGLVMNAAGFTCAGFALRDCIKGAGLPYVEVHISSIAKRNIHCVLSDVAEGMITGFGMHSYVLGLDAMLEILKKRTIGR